MCFFPLCIWCYFFLFLFLAISLKQTFTPMTHSFFCVLFSGRGDRTAGMYWDVHTSSADGFQRQHGQQSDHLQNNLLPFAHWSRGQTGMPTDRVPAPAYCGLVLRSGITLQWTRPKAGSRGESTSTQFTTLRVTVSLEDTVAFWSRVLGLENLKAQLLVTDGRWGIHCVINWHS